MRRRPARFAVVGLVATATDLTLLAVLRIGAGLPVLAADAISVAVATGVAFALRRRQMRAGDPYSARPGLPGVLLALAFITGAIDVLLLRGLAVLAESPVDTSTALLAAKIPALGVAALVRLLAYRRLLFDQVRQVQAQARPEPASGSVRLTVVVPAYKEEDRIGSTVDALRAALHTVGDSEIVVVDDGSGDATAAQARAAGADQVLTLERNRGKGAAVRAGMLAGRGRTIAFIDADLAYPPVQLIRLLEKVEEGFDVVVGSRAHVETTTMVRARRLREVSGRLFNQLTTLVLLGQYRDTQCGLKAFRSDSARAIFERSRLDGFAFDVEVFHLAERLRLSLAEVPVELSNTDTTSVRVVRDSLRMLRDLALVRWWAARGVYDTRSSRSAAPR